MRLAREATKMKEQWIRTAADFDNFRKRARRDMEDSRRGGREELLKELLPVFDNLERAIQSAQRSADVKAVSDGLAMVIKQFNDTLGRIGINRVPTIGSPFDPGVHEGHPAGGNVGPPTWVPSSPRCSPATSMESGSSGPPWWWSPSPRPTDRPTSRGSTRRTWAR